MHLKTTHRPELDGVRGIACLLVLIDHCVIGPLVLKPGSDLETVRVHLQPFLFGGVDLFFILSGFLISGILMDSRDGPLYFRRFWTRRIARIFPVYYTLIGF
jgi:peptidoglycan/LPS O-acetylase OafA/YrhL